jgi:hypothetical protein
MRFLFLLNTTGGALPEPGTPAAAEVFAAYREVTEAMAGAGVLVDCAPLQPRSGSTTVRVRDGETLTGGGHASEVEEHLGGYTVVECADLDEAVRWAARIPAARDASVEVRPVVSVQTPV